MDDISGNSGEGGSRQGRQTLRRAVSGESESPHHDPSRKLNLKAVVAGGLCVRQRRLGGAAEERAISRCAGQNRFRFTGPPGFHGDTAEREARFDNRVILDAQRRRGRHDRKCVGGAVANFQVTGMVGEPAASAGRRTATIISPGSSMVSRSGASPGKR